MLEVRTSKERLGAFAIRTLVVGAASAALGIAFLLADPSATRAADPLDALAGPVDSLSDVTEPIVGGGSTDASAGDTLDGLTDVAVGDQSSDDASTAEEPMPSATRTVEETVEPVVETVEPVVETVEPVVETVEPVVETVEQVTRTASAVVEPVTQVAEPVTRTVRAAAEPLVELAAPMVRAAEPVTRTLTAIVEPVVEVTEPLTRTVDAVAEPVTRTIEPIVHVAVPVVDSTTPLVDPPAGALPPMVEDDENTRSPLRERVPIPDEGRATVPDATARLPHLEATSSGTPPTGAAGEASSPRSASMGATTIAHPESDQSTHLTEHLRAIAHDVAAQVERAARAALASDALIHSTGTALAGLAVLLALALAHPAHRDGGLAPARAAWRPSRTIRPPTPHG